MVTSRARITPATAAGSGTRNSSSREAGSLMPYIVLLLLMYVETCFRSGKSSTARRGEGTPKVTRKVIFICAAGHLARGYYSTPLQHPGAQLNSAGHSSAARGPCGRSSMLHISLLKIVVNTLTGPAFFGRLTMRENIYREIPRRPENSPPGNHGRVGVHLLCHIYEYVIRVARARVYAAVHLETFYINIQRTYCLLIFHPVDT